MYTAHWVKHRAMVGLVYLDDTTGRMDGRAGQMGGGRVLIIKSHDGGRRTALQQQQQQRSGGGRGGFGIEG